MRRATLKDIAVKMGLDVSTVSRVLNHDSALRISDYKRAEVQRVANELGYVPHRSARSLRLQRTFIIGYVLNDVAPPSSMVDDLEFPVTRFRIYGLEEDLSRRGYMLSLLRLPVDDASALQEKVLRRHLVDGLVYNNHSPSAEAIQRLQHASMPAVCIDPFPPNRLYEGKINTVFSDRALGVRQAMTHLAARGYRQIAFVSSRSNILRRAGYEEAVQSLGLSDDPRLVRLFESQADNLAGARAQGYCMTRELLRSGVSFTAVQAGSDGTAAGVIDALREAGRSVPEDVAVMGYDDVEGLHGMFFPSPFLSTVRDPNFAMGACAAELLIARIEESAAPQKVMLQPELVLRHSA